MKTISSALVYAVAYINLRQNDDGKGEDGDVGALESIANELRAATEGELNALAEAAEKALEGELRGASRDEFIGSYRAWMEGMFGSNWIGNNRVS